MISELMWTKRRRLLAATVTCVVLIAGLVIFWQMGQVAEAAIIDPHPGLVGWWRFDEGEGIVAEDSSGFGNDGTIYGATWVDGKYGKALSFDGVDDYVEVQDDASIKELKSNFSFGCWVYINSFPATGREFILNKNYRDYNIHVNSASQIVGAVYDGIEQREASASASTGQWYHVFVVYNGTTILYLDGAPTVGASGGDVRETIRPLCLGSSATPDQFFDGIIDEVRIYNRALSASELETLFQKGPEFSSRLLAKVPKGITQFIVTLSWQGHGGINVTIESPSKIYTEDMVPLYQKTVYSTSGGTSDMLNIKRLTVSVTALSSDENWYIILEFDDVEDYRITVEIQR